MRTGRNLLAGVLGSVLTTLVGLAVIPLYLSYLGVEAYGVIGFFATTQALLTLLDMGIAPTINREIARCTASGSMPDARKLLRSLELVNWTVAAVVGTAIAVAADLVASHWLQSRSLSPTTLSASVMLMGLVIALRWPVALYQAALNGMHRLDLANTISVSITTLGSLGAVAFLAAVSSRLETFFLWQAGVAVVYMLVMRRFAWKTVGRDSDTRFDAASIGRVWRFSAGLSGIAVSALVLTQLDKVLLSRLLPLHEFGHYMLATTIAGGFSAVLFLPTFNVVYPLFSSLAVKGDTAELERSYRLGTRLLVSALFPLVMLLVLLSHDLLFLWTGNHEIASGVAPLLTLLALGAGLHGIMYFPYALQLAYGVTRLPLQINGLLLVFMVPLILFLATTYGAVGGALAWVVLNAIYIPLGTWLTHRELLPRIGARWLIVDVGIPAVITLIIGAVGAMLTQLAASPAVRVAYGVGCAATAALLCLLSSPSLHAASRQWFERRLATVAR
jgi:O-antigen/teichoic acid export membrane protein